MRLSFSMKLIAASVILASTTGLAFAKNYKGDYKGEVCPPPVMLKDGFYIGAQVGYDSYRVRTSFGSAILPSLYGTTVLNATGWAGGLFLGYGQYFNNLFYLAGEIFGTDSAANVRTRIVSTPVIFNAKYQVNGSWGLALLPGIKLNDTSLGYIRLGWNWASLKGRIGSSVVDAAGTVLSSASASRTRTSNGFNFGVGIETLIVGNWSVRGEFSHTWYNSFTANSVKYSPSNNEYMLGVLYHFA
jgi:outer membrane immunogenic protein